MSDMRAGPSALPSPGSWQFESVREQRGIWIGKSPCMFLGRNEAKGAEGNILQVLRLLGKWVFTEREEGWSVLLLGAKAGENGPSSSWGKVRGRWRAAALPCKEHVSSRMCTSCSAGVAARVQPVPGFAEGERNVSTQRLPAKREQAAQGKKCKADWLQEQKQESFFCLSPILSWSKSPYRACGELCPEDVILLTGACHTTILFALTLCAVLLQKAQEIWVPCFNFNSMAQTVLPNLKSSLDLWISMHRESITNPVCIFRSFITLRIKHAEL